MPKLTRRGERAVLLDVEEPGDSYRLETVDIPDPTLEEVTGEYASGVERSEPFSRSRERVPLRRRSKSHLAWRNRWVRLAAALAVLTSLGLVATVIWETETLLLHNPNFVLASSRNIQMTGNRIVPTRQALAFFAPDIGRSIFRVPLVRRQSELEQIDWVRAATVMRMWPNHLRIALVERTPIAFARDGSSVRLVDGDGVLLNMPSAAAQSYSFPVLTGINAADPASTRAARMQLYQQFIRALDAEGDHVSATLSEVDLSDPEDLRAVFTGGTRNPLVHLGDADFLPRYRAYQAYLAEWLQQYPQLRSVDMRYGKQIVLDTGTQSNADARADVAAPETNTQKASAAIPLDATSNVRSAAAPDKAMVSKKRIASKAGRSKVVRKPRRNTRRAASRHSKKIHKRVPERGHPVHDPIAHVVSGT